MSEEKPLICPVCGKTEVSREEWRDNLSKNRGTRALWASPYRRYERAWIYDNYVENVADLHKHRGVVEAVQFGNCGYQGIEIGLSLTITTEEGWSCGWTFYNIGDIAEFMERAKAKVLSDLVGTPVIEYSTSKGMGSVTGIDVVDNLVLEG
jgi:hypothetical protein